MKGIEKFLLSAGTVGVLLIMVLAIGAALYAGYLAQSIESKTTPGEPTFQNEGW